MFYKLTIEIATRDQLPINEVREQLQRVWPHAETINPGTDNAERSFILLQRCYHDEHPTLPCDEMFYVETT